MKKTNLIAWAMAALSLHLLTGCAGYRVGSMLPDTIKSVYIPTFINNTTEPLIEIDATQAAIEQFQRDGSLKLADQATADAELTVVLTSYKLEPVSFRKDIRTAAQQYRIFLTAKMEMRTKADGKVIVESPRIVGKYVFDVTGDLSSSKLSANPQVSQDLAKNLIEMLVEYWP